MQLSGKAPADELNEGFGQGRPKDRSCSDNGALEARRWTGEGNFALRQLKDACSAGEAMGLPDELADSAAAPSAWRHGSRS